jgi:YegS/Rv2252/BmrU family lipid kinase
MTGSRAGKKKAVIILNGISLKKKLFYHEYLPAISSIFDTEVHETLSKNDAKALAAKHAEKYPDVIIAAGGDGTLNQVVNGILKGREEERKLPAIGIIPIGSGNDFARGAGLKGLPQTMAKLMAFEPRLVDVGLIEYSEQSDGKGERASAYFVNMADIGMGPEVVGKVLASGRPFGSAVAYYKSILNTFLTYKPMVVKAQADNWQWQGKVRTLAVANGPYYGHGLCVAPDAKLDDRKFSVFICGDVSVFDFVMHTGSLKKGKTINMDEVQYKSTTAIGFSSEVACPIEGDGEMLGWLPANVTMIGRQLELLI